MKSRLLRIAAAISAHRPRAARVAFLAFGALIFAAVFFAHLHGVDPDRYVDRDDGLITLSHARNLVEFGFIGTSPSGERVEGYSAPLQFIVSAAAYAATRFDYPTFFRWQTILGTLALGAAVAGLLWSASGGDGARLLFSGGAVIAIAQILASSTAFLWWHASGMENVYKSVGLVLVLWTFDAMLRGGRIWWSSAALVFLTSIARVDGIVPVTMLAGTFAALWFKRRRDGQGVALVAAALLLWLAFMGVRWWYFGQWVPNTGPAQNISVADRILITLASPASALRDYLAWLVTIGPSLFAFQLLGLIPLALYLRRTHAAIDRTLLIGAGALSCLAQFALFGPARMDLTRTVTELALYSTVALPLVWLSVETFDRRHVAAGLVVLAVCTVTVTGAPPHRPAIGWGARQFAQVVERFEDISSREDIPRPTVANPDLGAVSWQKHFNVIDLGRLGSTLPTHLPNFGAYLASLAQPDIIELHAPWSCLYPDLFSSAAFGDAYIRITPTQPAESTCPGPTGDYAAYWVRRAVMKDSLSPERAFLERFRHALDPALVEAELARCLPKAGLRPCGYVGRTVFRFRPELVRNGGAARIEELLGRDAKLRIDLAMFMSASNPRWWRVVEDALSQRK